ncbi:hypothetical protein SAMN05444365_102225 [Micromonospora pattaloongensis]|uniref:Tetratricopeptide repeat-containing protein n=1 Tax=Micromonospora pattaloongensis TaxID=405436 RepID=A0A1H3JRF1_9ACTN|nr:hypothetical protein [Micromonospora pattaloongensis]SDY42506.1 hypothetical protein SAMN05444365_102225 [Micromonospora pattaloongensis]
MTASEQDLQERLRQAYGLPTGPARFAALDAVFRHADAAGNVAFGFNARMNAITDFHHGGDPTRTFLAFSWCLSVFDRQPELVSRHHANALLWRFKWVVWGLPQFPEIPLDRTVAVLDDMERRYLLGGHSLHAVYQHRWLVAHHVGDTVAAQEWYDNMVTARRDSLSDCSACVPSSQVRHLASLNRFDEAITVGEPFKNGGCTEQPQWILAELLLPYLYTGRFDEAVQAHRDGYRRIRDDRHHLDNIASHVLFCGLSGNEARGLEIVERHLAWLARPSSPYAALEFGSAAALVLGRLRASGHGDLVLRRRSDDGSRRWESTVEQLHDELTAQVRSLAARFDARNGNDHQSRRAEARMAAQPVVDQLPLTVLAGRVAPGKSGTDRSLTPLLERVAELTAAGDEAGAARARLDVAHALRNAGRWEDAVEAAEEAMRALHRAGLASDATRCRYLLWQLYSRAWHHRNDAIGVLDEILDADAPADRVPPPEVLLEEAADVLGGGEAVTRLLAAADRHRAHAARSAELRTLRKALTLMGAQAPTDLATATLDRADTLIAADRNGTADEAAYVDVAAARLLAAADQVDAAIGRLDRALVHFEAAALPQQLADALIHRARLQLKASRPIEAEAQARDVLATEPERHGWTATMIVAKSLRMQGRTEDAAQFMAEHEIDDDDLEYYEEDEDE